MFADFILGQNISISSSLDIKDFTFHFLRQKIIQDSVSLLCRTDQPWRMIFSAVEENGMLPISVLKSIFEWSLRRISKTSIDFDASSITDIFKDSAAHLNTVHSMLFIDLSSSVMIKLAGDSRACCFLRGPDQDACRYAQWPHKTTSSCSPGSTDFYSLCPSLLLHPLLLSPL